MNNDIKSVHSIDHYALNVPSLEQAKHFFSNFGLDITERDGALELRPADGQLWARVFLAPSKSLAYLSFNCFADDYDAIRRQVEVLVDDVAEKAGEGFWFHDPDGNLLNVKVGDKKMPDEKTKPVYQQRYANQRGEVTRDQAPFVRPRRLSHVLIFSPDVLRAIDFFHYALGLRLSDKSEDIIAFTHAQHGCDHHLVAFAKSSAKGWHHAAWEVESVEEVGVGAEQMRKAGYTEGWGLGRHCLGSNYFHYVRDPWGSFNEYSFDIDYIEGDAPWSAGDYEPENSLYLWGPETPEWFIHNTEA